MRIPASVHNLLNRYNVELTHYDRTQECRRQKLLNHLGVRHLVDVGANAGQYAKMVRQHGYRGSIWSAEPLLEPFAELSRAAARDPLWHAERVALSAEPGELTLYVSENSQFSSASPVDAAVAIARPEVRQEVTQVVPMDTLDSALADVDLTGPTGVKIDVQGHEAAVFDGASETLARAAFLEFEMSMREIYAGQELFPEMLARVLDMGFTLALAESLWATPSGQAYQMNGVFMRA